MRRRGYLDWLRGVAVLIMIEAHLFDAWVRQADRSTPAYSAAIIVGGFGAPLFLFLAGVAVSMSAGSKSRRSGSTSTASRALIRRGLEISGLAFLFRVQAWILGGGSARGLLKVDILNIMGPSIMAAAALWGAARGTRARLLLFASITLTVAMMTPVLRNAPFIVALPAPLEAYFRPVPGLTNFVFLPWSGFVFAGAFIGVMLDSVRPEKEGSSNCLLAIAGVSIASLSFALSFLPSSYTPSYFWTTSPTFFFLRTGLMTAAIAGAYAWESRPGGSERFSPVRQLGRTSLFVYWIHVEMIYGLISAPLHRALTFGQACLAFVIFATLMLVCSLAKDNVVAAWRRHARAVPAVSQP